MEACPPNDHKGPVDHLPVDFIRAEMAAGNRHICVFQPRQIRWDVEDLRDTYPAPKIETLTVRRMSAPAPYVGDRFLYTWDVAIGDVGWVSGPVRVEAWPSEWDMSRRAVNSALDMIERDGNNRALLSVLRLINTVLLGPVTEVHHGQA